MNATLSCPMDEAPTVVMTGRKPLPTMGADDKTMVDLPPDAPREARRLDRTMETPIASPKPARPAPVAAVAPVSKAKPPVTTSALPPSLGKPPAQPPRPASSAPRPRTPSTPPPLPPSAAAPPASTKRTTPPPLPASELAKAQTPRTPMAPMRPMRGEPIARTTGVSPLRV